MTSRLRELGLTIGTLPVGPRNSITDVDGITVGHSTVIEGDDVRTGVTVIRPREDIRMRPCFAGTSALNGNGDLIGTDWVRESGLLTTPIGITNTHSVGVVRDALVSLESAEGLYWSMPVVGETYDGLLNDIRGQHVTREHVVDAFTSASAEVVEGAVGGGTGMICHGFKGGIGTSSRLVDGWTVGVLVQANHGLRADLRLDGWPVGRELLDIPEPGVTQLPPGSGSIITIVATDAPLTADQCRRLALRTFVGIARSGGGCSDSSGDISLCFSTADQGIAPERYYPAPDAEHTMRAIAHQRLSPLFEAVSEATEEAILSAMLHADTMVGKAGITAHGLTGQQLIEARRRLIAQG